MPDQSMGVITYCCIYLALMLNLNPGSLLPPAFSSLSGACDCFTHERLISPAFWSGFFLPFLFSLADLRVLCVCDGAFVPL